MLKQKKKKCKTCNRETYIFSKGDCKVCAVKRYSKKTAVKTQNRRDFFKSNVGGKGYCIESGTLISPITVWNLCHIFPKRIYKSIETNEYNIILLTAEMHAKLDGYLDSMDLDGLKKNMPKSYDFIIANFEILEPLIEERSGKLFNLIRVEHEKQN